MRRNVCKGSSTPPESFDCGSAEAMIMIESDLIADTSTTQSLEPAEYPAGWTSIFKEDFTYGYGLFYHQSNSAIHYTSTMNRVGVVRIAGGEGGCPTLRSNPVSLKNISSTRIRVGFSFYAIGMEHSDYFCIQCEIDETITGETSCLRQW
mmetsp:Transcript_43664/g.91877  ORF Transcript_43664/g.91877 Transcript_43664/m.91877 type:complete len:150 (-) Transcript_43664:153-602(-)